MDTTTTLQNAHAAKGRGPGNRLRWLPATLLSLAVAGPAQAVSIDAGDYTTLPGGTHLQVYYAQFAQSNNFKEDDEEVGDRELQTQVGIYRAVQYYDIEGFGVIDPQILVPFGRADPENLPGGAAPDFESATGIGDPILAMTWWPITDYEERRHFGITPFIWVPIGSYNQNEPINFGENRWKAALQVGYIEGFGKSPWLVDVSADVQIHGTNDEFFAGTEDFRIRDDPDTGERRFQTQTLTTELEQDELYDVQGFLRYQTSNPGELISNEVNLRVRYLRGGEQRVGGVGLDDSQETVDLMATYMHWFGGNKVQTLWQVGRDVHREEGFEEDFRFQFRVLIPFLPE